MGSRVVRAHASAAIIALWCACVGVCGSPTPTVHKDIIGLVHELAANCSDNLLLGSDYASEIAPCSGHLITKTRLQCLSFLDVNRRLCGLKQFASFNLSERLHAESSKNLSIETLCNTTGSIALGSLPEYPDYANITQKVLAVRDGCFRLCASEDLLAKEPNFFCRALYWGSNVINNVKIEIERAGVKDTPPLQPNGVVASHLNDHESKHNISTTTDHQAPPESFVATNLHSGIGTNVGTSSNSASNAGLLPSNDKNIVVIPNPAETDDNKHLQNIASAHETKPLSSADGINNANREESRPEISGVKPPSSSQALAGQTPEPGTLNATNTEQDNNRDSIGSYPEELDEEISIPDNSNLGVQEQTANEVRVPQHNPIQKSKETDDYLEEDSGHFFSMFFTGVILMVLLYVLYHNKNKLMGLIIEGRQPGGRRRNSRGHSYKRLDTLEQAISSSGPGVTPSKIIY